MCAYVRACLSFTLYDRKVRDNYSSILFCHNILLWIVLVGAAKPCAALQVLKKVTKTSKFNKRLEKEKKQEETQTDYDTVSNPLVF